MTDMIARALADSAKAGSINVKDFGANGDYKDDTVAIQKAIDMVAQAGGGEVIMPSGNFNISATIEIKPNVHLNCSHGCTIRPTANINIIHLRKNAQISGAKIDTYDFIEFSKSCIYLDGSDRFNFTHNTSIRSMVLYGRGPRVSKFPPTLDGSPTVDHDSTGIHMYASGDGNNVVAVHVYDVNIMYFGKGIHLHAENAGGGTSQWVNGNQFDMIGFSDNQYDIYMTGGLNSVQDGVYSTSGNMFTNIQTQPSGVITRQCFHINGRFNRIIAMVWDIQLVKSGILARLTDKSGINIISSNLEKSNVDDQGKNNNIDAVYETNDSFGGTMLNGVIPPMMSEVSLLAGNQDDALAFADKRGFTVIQKQGPAPEFGSLTSVFDLVGYTTVRWDVVRDPTPIVIEILFPAPVLYFESFGVSFGNWQESPKNIKLEKLYQGVWTDVYIHENLRSKVHIIKNSVPYNTEGFRLTLSGSNASSGKLRISRIFGQSSQMAGAAFLPTIGGSVYGNIDMRDNYIVLGNKTALPAASATYRGYLVMVQGSAGVEDVLYICTKDSKNAYTWKKVGLIV